MSGRKMIDCVKGIVRVEQVNAVKMHFRVAEGLVLDLQLATEHRYSVH
jgi:hypothetical protein